MRQYYQVIHLALPDTLADNKGALIMIELNDSAERINYPFQKIEGDTIIVDPKERLMHQLNDFGSRVWELLTRKQAISDIINAIADEYEVDSSTAREDITQLLDKMFELKLIHITHNE